MNQRARKRHGLVGPAALWEMKRRFQIDFLRRQGLLPSHELLDLGCGTLRGGIPLIDYLETGHYAGIDVRDEVIGEARKELEEHGLAHKLPELVATPDLAGLALPRTFDVAWAFSVLIHMPDEVLAGAFDFVARHLKPQGIFFANANVGEREPAGWQGFPVVWRPAAFYTEAAATAGLVAEDIGSLGELGHLSQVAAQDAQRMFRFRFPSR